MGTTNDEAYLCLKALASSVRRNKSLILPLISHVCKEKQRKVNENAHIARIVNYWSVLKDIFR